MSKQETHTHTHPFNGPLSRTTQVSRYQKGNTNLDFSEARDSEWQWHQLGHMQVSTSLQTDNHASTPPLSFLQARCPSCCPTNSVEALKARKCNKYSVVATDSMYLQEAVQSRSLSTFLLAGIPGLFFIQNVLRILSHDTNHSNRGAIRHNYLSVSVKIKQDTLAMARGSRPPGPLRPRFFLHLGFGFCRSSINHTCLRILS